MDICCDSMCNIISADRIPNNDSVHIIDCNGSFLKYLFTPETCLPKPSSIALHKDVLWPGSYSGKVVVYRYEH